MDLDIASRYLHTPGWGIRWFHLVSTALLVEYARSRHGDDGRWVFHGFPKLTHVQLCPALCCALCAPQGVEGLFLQLQPLQVSGSKLCPHPLQLGILVPGNEQFQVRTPCNKWQVLVIYWCFCSVLGGSLAVFICFSGCLFCSNPDPFLVDPPSKIDTGWLLQVQRTEREYSSSVGATERTTLGYFGCK